MADFLSLIQKNPLGRPLKIAITGGVHSGKTTRASEWIDIFRSKGMVCIGCLERAVFDAENKRIGYDFEDIHSGESRPFARRVNALDGCWKYQFNDQIWSWYERGYKQFPSPDIVVFDELGRLEASGDGIMPFVETYIRENQAVSAYLFVCRGDVMDMLSEKLSGFDEIERISKET